MKQVRVLVVDDSPSMRALIRNWLERDGDIVVVGEAGDPYEAREAIKLLSPDVVTLDINMPRMDGLEFLEKLMRLRPTPVVMLSSEIGGAAAASIDALATGAFDCVAKPQNGNTDEVICELNAKVKAASLVRPSALVGRGILNRADGGFTPNQRIVAIGASTGGVDALMSLLSAFPENCPPTMVVQHMPASFTRGFAHRLDQHCAPTVLEAWNGAPLETGRVYIAPGGNTHLEVFGRKHLFCKLSQGDPQCGHRPSVDVLFASVAHVGPESVGVILTGMGRDGAEGLLKMRRAGAATIGQSRASSLVYGMPRAAAEIGATERELSLEAMPSAILSLCSKQPSH